jgi:leader peptidase (prepilin peptidase)/N-methyltransferase
MSADVDSVLGLLVTSPWSWLFALFAAVLGAAWGSFFNVAIHRLGLYESVLWPPSRCPSCGVPIRWYDNVPLLSWLWLRGRCRACAQPISLRYPLVELVTMILALALYWRFVLGGDGDPVARIAHFLVYFAFAGTLLVLAGIDFDHKIIPDTVTYPAIPAFFVCGLFLRDVTPFDLVLGMAAGYGGIALTAELAYLIMRRDAMGYGDAKLLMLVGALMGWKAVLFTFFAAAVIGAVVLVPVALARRGRVVGVEIPYGPFLAAAAMVYLFFGRELLALVLG